MRDVATSDKKEVATSDIKDVATSLLLLFCVFNLNSIVPMII